MLAVVNFPPRQIGPFRSEVLTLGLADAAGAVVLVAPDRDVPLGRAAALTALPRVVVTRKLPEAVEARLRGAFDAALNPEDAPCPPARLAEAMREADGLLCAVTDLVDAAAIGDRGTARRGSSRTSGSG